MNRIMIQIFTYLVLSSLLGTSLYLVWKVFGSFVEKKGYIDISYCIWKIVLLSFLCPIPFFVILQIRNKGLYGFDFWETQIIVTLEIILCTIWIIGMIICIAKHIGQHRKIHNEIKKIGYNNKEVENQVNELCDKLNIHRKVEVICLEFMKIPMVYGLIKPKILIPENEYDIKTLEVILIHELVHHKHHDLFWKQLFRVVKCIYWFHPAMKDILRQLDQWGETACDITVSKYIDSIKEYFGVIIEMAVEKPECDVYMAGLSEGTQLIMLRMKRMKIYMNQKPLRKIVAAGLMLGIVGISATTVLASSLGFAKGYSYIAYETVPNEKEQEKDVDYAVSRTEMKRMNPDSEISKITKIKQKLPKTDEAKGIDIKIKPKQRMVMKERYIDAKKAKEIEISVSTELDENSCKNIAIGIINERKEERYIRGDTDEFNDILWHGFEIKKSGKYTLYIENYGDEERQVMGFCAVNSYITLEEKKK